MKFESPRSGTLLLCILAAGLIARIATVALFHPPLFSDDIDYVALGKSLAHGEGYQLEGHPTAYRPPGYPLLLAVSFRLFGESLLPVRAAQAAADLLSCFLVFLLGRRLFSERAGLIGAGIFALFPMEILYVSIMMTETVFTTLLLLYLLICTGAKASWKMSIAAGIVLGAATLVRPTVLLLPGAVFVVRWMSGWKPPENLKALGISAGAALLILSPWIIRNEDRFGHITLTSNTGVNFWIGTHSGASGSYSFPENNPLSDVKDEFSRSDLGIRLGAQFIRERPLEYGVILAKKWAHFFSVDYWLLLSMHYQPDFRLAPRAGVVFSRFPLPDLLVLHVPFAAVLLLATFGLCFHARGDRLGILFLFAPVTYWILVHLAFYASARYRFPVVPLLMAGGAYGADILLRRVYVRTPLRRAAFCFFALLFVSGWTAERVIIRREAGAYGAQTRDVDSVRAVIAGMNFPLPDLPPVPDSVAGAPGASQSLDGTWDFSLKGSDPKGHGSIDVPGEWEMQGFHVPQGTPAIYRKSFELPRTWERLRVFVRFDAVSSYCSVRVNGIQAGTHEGSFAPFAFDITGGVRAGRNVIEAEVMCGTISDTLACTSQYAAHPVGGILRKVTLYALPPTHVAGLTYATRFDAGYRDAFMEIACTIAGGDLRRTMALSYSLTDAGGNTLLRSAHDISAGAGNDRERTDRCTLSVASPHPWDPEHPTLYTLTTTLIVDGRAVQTNRNRIGFRQIELRGNRLFVNNRPTKLRGINHHEVHPLRGRSLTPALCRMDVELFRAANCNYIRTSHYPPSEELLEACDELGMFVESEASLCWIAHGAAPVWNSRDERDTAILPCMVRANIENVLAGRAHTCVIIWSLGNESRWSPLWERVNTEVKKLDPTRVTSFHDQSWGPYNNAGSRADIANYHYPGFDGPAICDKTVDRPTLFGEYMHVQTYARREIETDPGVRSDPWARTLNQMVDSVYAHPACLGGAIWSGVDDIFHLSSSRICGYGAWGPLDGWRRRKPEYTGIRKSYSPVVIRNLSAPGFPGGVVRFHIENRYNTTNLSELGITAQAGDRKIPLRADIPPLGSGILDVDLSGFPRTGLMLVSFRDPRGFLCAEEAIRLEAAPAASAPGRGHAIALGETSGSFLVRSGNITYEISKREGVIGCIMNGNDTVATRGGELILIPHNTDDGGAPGTSGNNYTQDLRPLDYYPEGNFTARAVTASRHADGTVRLDVRGTFGGRLDGMVTMTFGPDGPVQFRYDYRALVDFTPAAKSLIRQYGLLFTLPASFDRLEWKRKGLWTVYPEYDPGRLEGTARANPRESRFVEEPRRRPEQEWKEDANALGSNDFRGTKDHILRASLTGVRENELTVTSDGTQSARAWVQNGTVRFLVAGLNGPGSCTFFTGPRPEFPKGSHLTGAFTLDIH